MPISTIGQNGLNAPLSLTTPALGTPSSLVLTNATGLPQAGLGTNVVGNGSAFSAYLNSGQGFSANTATKVLLDVEYFDTNNNFASSRFTPTVAGYYQINGGVGIATLNTSYWVYLIIYKNGNEFLRGSSVFASSANYPSTTGSGVLYLNGSTDYVELYMYSNASATSLYSYSAMTFMSGCLIRSA